MVAATGWLSACYAVSAVTLHRDPAWNVLPNALSYFANTVVAWMVARTLRRTARELDASRTAELEQWAGVGHYTIKRGDRWL